MRLLRLRLEEFRCYQGLDLEVPAAGARIFGQNASGKTTLLEAISMLSTTRSPRATVERELIRFDSAADLGLPPFARIVGHMTDNGGDHSIELSLAVDGVDRDTTRKRIKVDGQPRRAIDAVGRLKVVLFQPEDLDLVLGGPSVRRRYLDVTLATLDRGYLRALSQYGRILEQRNSLLKRLRDRANRSSIDASAELEYWDAEWLTRAAFLTVRRMRYLSEIAEPLRARFQQLAGEAAPELDVRYHARIELDAERALQISSGEPTNAQRVFQHELERGLAARRDEELRRGVTVLGPHRDDFGLMVGSRDLGSFGSRGQQRLGVVALKLAELDGVRRISGEQPVLLLDDVLSELDESRRTHLLELLSAANCQTIVTATDRVLLELPELEQLPLFSVKDGSVDRAD